MTACVESAPLLRADGRSGAESRPHERSEYSEYPLYYRWTGAQRCEVKFRRVDADLPLVADATLQHLKKGRATIYHPKIEIGTLHRLKEKAPQVI